MDATQAPEPRTRVVLVNKEDVQMEIRIVATVRDLRSLPSLLGTNPARPIVEKLRKAITDQLDRIDEVTSE